MSEPAFYHAAVALAAGMAAQVLAVRMAVPGIVVLLATGAVLGPDVLGFLDPTVFGAGRGDLVSLAVTVILFEGALALDLERLRHQQRNLLLLLTIGAAVSMAGGALAAHAVLGIRWPIATLYGALVIVTGPTVVTPLLARLTIDRPVRELLVSEGVLIDPIGAIVAIVALDYVLGSHEVLASGWLLLVRLGLGGAIGAVAGLLLVVVLRRRILPEELINPSVLGSVLLVAALASRVSAEAGLIAPVAQGIALGNARLREMGPLRDFKETLTLILLSFIFVVLAADLRLAAVGALGWGALAVVALLVWVARPLAVLASTAGSGLDLRQRAFVAWICPRGIVAAAVAGLFRIRLGEAGVAGGNQLEALVFVTVACTVVLQGLTARRVAHLLGVDVPRLVGTIVVGADLLGRLLARLLAGLERQVVVIDRSPALCRRARAEGLSVYEGDALSTDTLEEAGARYADTVVALTRNPELNALVCQRVHDDFRVERVLAVAEGPAADEAPEAGGPFPGRFPGVDAVNELLRRGRLRVAEYDVPEGEAAGRPLGDLAYGPDEFALLVRRGEGVFVATGETKLAAGDRLWCARPPKAESPLAALLTPAGETDARAGGPGTR